MDNKVFKAVHKGFHKLFSRKGTAKGIKEIEGPTPLHIAAKGGLAHIVEHLLNYGISVNLACTSGPMEGYTPLHFAAESGNERIIKMLLSKGADVNSKGNDGSTPLHLAAKYRHKATVVSLLEHGADINSRDENGKTALHIACEFQGVEIIENLLKYDADVNVTDREGKTALDFAQVNIHHYYHFHNIYDIAGHLQRHIVKIRAANMFVNERNLLSISCICDLSIFNSSCEKEIKKMRDIKLSTDVSYYDILTKDVSQLSLYVRNENIARILELEEYKEQFPIYASIMDFHIKKGRERKCLLDSGAIAFNGLIQFELPYFVNREILIHLSEEDLRNLIKAYH